MAALIGSAVVAVALLLASCADVPQHRVQTPPGSIPAPTATLPAPVVPTGVASDDMRLLEVARAVESDRGHPFLRPVTVEFLDDATFRAHIAHTDEPAEADLHSRAAVLEAVGAIPPGFDLAAAGRKATAESVVGSYDPITGQLVVRGGLTAYSLVVVDHELTHALDDQWFALDGLVDPASTDDRRWASRALMEGSAGVAEDAYLSSLPLWDLAEAADEANQFIEQMDVTDLPPDLYREFTDVYDAGRDFVRAIEADGGTAALDAAFRSPPASSEQVLHVDRYRAADPPVALADPPADGTVTASGELGEVGLLSLLQLRLVPAVARQAAAGWGGDRYVVWATPTGSCLRVDVVLDGPDDARELDEAGRQWAAVRGGSAVVTDGGAVRLTTCR